MQHLSGSTKPSDAHTQLLPLARVTAPSEHVAARHRHVGQNYACILCLLILPLLSGCADTNATNDCLIQAVRAKSELPRDAWSRVLLVKYGGGSMGHAYTVFELPGHRVFAYDSILGSRRIAPRSLYLADLVTAVDRRAVTGNFLEETYAGPPLNR